MRLRAFILGRACLFASIDRIEACRIAHGRTHEQAWRDRLDWFQPNGPMTEQA